MTQFGATNPDDAAGKKFFFVLGHARSGTNWTCALLNLHPRVNCHGEYHFERLQRGVDEFTRGPFSLGAVDRRVNRMAGEWFEEFVRRAMLTQADRRPEAEWLGDRTPRPLLPLHLKGAPHVLVIRDGRDVVVSRIHHIMRLGGPNVEPFKSRLQADVEAFRENPDYYNEHPERLFRDVELLERYVRQWAEWVKRDLAAVEQIRTGELDATVHVVQYEHLHAEPERERAKMYRFLSLDPEEAEPLSLDDRTAPGFEKEDPRSLFRKGEVGDWRRYANDEFVRFFKEYAGDLLIQLGYETDTNW